MSRTRLARFHRRRRRGEQRSHPRRRFATRRCFMLPAASNFDSGKKLFSSAWLGRRHSPQVGSPFPVQNHYNFVHSANRQCPPNRGGHCGGAKRISQMASLQPKFMFVQNSGKNSVGLEKSAPGYSRAKMAREIGKTLLSHGLEEIHRAAANVRDVIRRAPLCLPIVNARRPFPGSFATNRWASLRSFRPGTIPSPFPLAKLRLP